MANRKSIASTLIFLGSTMCFFFPFVTVSCGGIKAFTLSGQQLATGTTLTQPQAFGPPQTQKIDGDPFAAVAGLCAVAGIALSLIGRRMASGAAVSGGVGALSLFIMKSRLDEQLQKQGQGLATASYESGFTLAVLLLISGTAWNVYLLLQGKRINAAVPLNEGASQSGSQHSPVLDGSSPPAPEQQSSLTTPNGSEGQPRDTGRDGQVDVQCCSHCGQPIRSTARFCEACGKSAELSEVSPETQTH